MRDTYWRTAAESDLGEGVAYFEFQGEWATRQVEVYGEHWVSSRDEQGPIGPNLCDQPLSELELLDEEQITKEEFEVAWTRSGR
jgi:hypothetical protein